MKRMILAFAGVLAFATSAVADVCVETVCPDQTTGTLCCPDPDPMNITPPSGEVVTCGAITADAGTYIAGCIGSDAGMNNIAGCTSVGGAVTTNDVLMEDSDCAADAVAACEACGCAVSSCAP